MAAQFITGTLKGDAKKYKYKCKVSGSCFYEQSSGKVIANISYSIQAINRTTGQECLIRPYTCTITKTLVLNADAPLTEFNIDIDTNNLPTLHKV